MKFDIHLIGPFPPPYGGVATHISRLRNRLQDDGHSCTVWAGHECQEQGLRKLPAVKQAVGQLMAIPHEAIFHFHGRHKLAGQLAKRGRKVLFTVHNERINIAFRGSFNPKTWLLNRLAEKSFLNIRQLIAVSDNVRDELIRFGFPNEDIHVFPAYLRPHLSESTTEPPEAFKIFRRRFELLLSANATAPKIYQNSDLYGMDLCIKLMKELADDYSGLGIVLVVPGGEGSTYVQHLKILASSLSVEDRILWLFEPGAYFPILRKCDLFLRPTNTDGFSLSVAEAFECSLPVIASDAVARPEGCLIFENRDLKSLAGQTKYALDNLPSIKADMVAREIRDCYDKILAVYRSLYTSGN